MKRRTDYKTIIALSLIAGFALSACGIRGDLKTPPPIWGEDIRSAAEKAEDAKTEPSENGLIIQAPETVE
jgi:predicted small lipoprotein YifL